MRRTTLPTPVLTAAGTATRVVEAWWAPDGQELDSPEGAARWARAYYSPQGQWLTDETGDMSSWATLDTTPQADPHWSGPLVFEGIATGDGRMIQPGALHWDDKPIPLYAVEQEGLGLDGHAGQQVVGRVDRLWRDGDAIWGEGTLDLSGSAGAEVARRLSEGFAGGVSADLDSVSVSVRVAADVIAAHMEADPEQDLPAPDEDGRVEVGTFAADDELMVTTEGRIRAATMVGTPAFSEAHIQLTPTGQQALSALTAAAAGDVDVQMRVATPEGDGTVSAVADTDGDLQQITVELDSGEVWTGDVADVDRLADTPPPPTGEEGEDMSLAAAAVAQTTYPLVPPAEWFTYADRLQARVEAAGGAAVPMQYDTDGAVHGFLATFDTCHTAFDTCVTAPTSPTGYSMFHVGTVEATTADGQSTLLPCGRITLGGGHAPLSAEAVPARQHYDESGAAVADVVALDVPGVGVALMGALRPGVTPEQIRELRSSPLSGDWRAVRTQRGHRAPLDLVAACAVVVPGFPIPSPQAHVASGQPVSLLASSGVLPPPSVTDMDQQHMDPDTAAALRRWARRQRAAEATRLRAKVHGPVEQHAATLAARVHTATPDGSTSGQ